MLDHANTRVIQSQMIPKHSSVVSVEEGSVLVRAMENGKATARPSTGAANELCVGISRAQFVNPTEAPMVETFKVPAASPFTVTLAKTPLLPDTAVGCWIDGSAGVVDTTPDATLDFFIVGNVATFHADDAGKTVKMSYRYALTVTEAQILYGQAVGDAAMSVVDGLDSITAAQQVATTMFDPLIDWAAGGVVTSGAGGRLTVGGNGPVIDKCYVLEAPSAENNMHLVVYFSI